MKITFKAKIIVDSPEHLDIDEDTNDRGAKYPMTLTFSEVRRLLSEDLLDGELVIPYDNEPTIIFKLKDKK